MMGRVLSLVLMAHGPFFSSYLMFLQLLLHSTSVRAASVCVLFHSISVLAVVGGMNGD